MEPVVDFGLFELLAAAGLSFAARWIYRRRYVAFATIAIGVIAPVATLVLADGEIVRWLAALSLAVSLVNSAVLIPMIRSGASQAAR